jgi:glycosyl hydrolase family 26
MQSAGQPGDSRLRAFMVSRTGIALALIVVGGMVAATALGLAGGEEKKLPPVAPAAGLPLPLPLLSPAPGTLFGAHTRPNDRTVEGQKSATEALEAHLGRKLDIDHNFYPWDDHFPTDIERWDVENGRIPMISWNGRGVTTAHIAAGRYDGFIAERARGVKSLGKTVLLRWFWEMDGRKKAEWAGTPEEYIAAWRHIHGIFEAQGTDNVQWVWCPNASAFGDGRAQAFYPGDAYVDWICGDGYNWAPGRSGDIWESFGQIFSPLYAWAKAQNKPIMVGEFGVQERDAGEKANWVSEAAETIKRDFPLIKAIVYFNSDQDYDWRMNTSDSAYDAFRQMANDAWFDLSLNLDRRLP